MAIMIVYWLMLACLIVIGGLLLTPIVFTLMGLYHAVRHLFSSARNA